MQRKVIELHNQGFTYPEIGKELGISHDAVYRLIHKPISEYISTIKPTPLPKPLLHKGDATIISDVHVLDTADRLVTMVAGTGLDTLILAGDLFNLVALSRFPLVSKPDLVGKECDAAEDLMSYFLQHFNKIIWFTGNHDDRIATWSRAEFTLEDLYKRIVSKAERNRVTLSPLNYMYLTSGGTQWMIAHPYKYSRIRLKKAQDYNNIYHCNILSAHEHHAGLTISTDGLYTLANNPMLCDEPDYSMVQLSDLPRMCKGFSIIKSGRIEQYIEGALFGIAPPIH